MAYEGNYEFPHTRTYDGDLGFLIKRYNELYNMYSSINAVVEELQDALKNLPQSIQQEVNRQLSVAMQNVYNILNEYDERISNAENSVNNMRDRVNNIELQINSLIKQIAQVLGFIEHYTDAIGEKVYNQLKELVEQWSKDLPPVICPVDGNLESISVALQHIFAYYNQGISAADYDNLVLTAQEYDEMRITAGKYDGFAYQIFKERRVCTMVSPFTGQIDYIRNVVNRLVDFHRKGISAEKYDLLSLTAQSYDNENITAYVYDFNNPYAGNVGDYVQVGDLMNIQANNKLFSAVKE